MSKFQPAVQHYGVDILAAKDAPISSIMDGIVVGSDVSLQTGNSVYINIRKTLCRCTNITQLFIGKNRRLVKKTGQAIAIIGNSGNVTGPHLHFEMWYDGKVVNPENYINFN